MTHASLFTLAAGSYLAGAAASLIAARDRVRSGLIATIAAGIGGAALWMLAARAFATPGGPGKPLLAVTMLGAGLVLRVDALSAVFLALGGTIGFLATLFSIRFMEPASRDTVARYYPLLLVLLLAIAGVVVTADFVFFLVFWELMTFTSFFLVAFEKENPAAQRAAFKYFVVNQAGALALLAAALVLWTRSRSFEFGAMRDALAALLADSPGTAHLALALFFLGFATKAGILPMGDWLPDAYGAAPAGATAAFSGTMTKLGIYGILRIFLGLLPVGSPMRAWGVVIALFGAASLFVGTLTALRQDDVKRLMSFHVIGQVGYMFLGIGLGLHLLRSNPAMALVAFVAAVFHMVNNALYKTSLFFGAGAVQHRTGERNVAALGGLAAAMPVTGMCALLAALAIAGVPPLNGFASKWLLYGAGILGGREAPLFVLLVLVAMFISLVTLASFMKYAGGVFLGGRAAPAAVREVPVSMLVPQAVLVAACVLFGLVPALPLRVLRQAVSGLAPGAGLPATGSLLAGTGIHVHAGDATLSTWSPLAVTLALALFSGLVWFLFQRPAGAARREVDVWTCGEEVTGAAAHYPATSFYLPFKHAFQGIYPATRVRAPRFPRRLRAAFDLDRWFYVPLGRAVEKGARQASRTHVGIPQVYLLWIVAGAVLVIAIMLAFAREGWMRP